MNTIIAGLYELYLVEIDSTDLELGDMIFTAGDKQFPPTMYEVYEFDDNGWLASGGQDMHFIDVPKVIVLRTRRIGT